MALKMRGETQPGVHEPGVVREGPTYSVYTGTQPGPHITGVWRRKSADVMFAHSQTEKGRESRHRMRAEHAAIQQENEEHRRRLRGG